MEDLPQSAIPVSSAARQLFHRLLTVGENRIHLLITEVQEERDRLLDAVFLSVSIAALGLLGGMAWTAAIVVLFWQTNPVAVLGGLGAVYLIAAILLCWRLAVVRRCQQPLAATIDQLRKDKECLKQS